MNNRFTSTNYDTRNQAFHFNDRTANFYKMLCISLQAYLGGTLVYHGITVPLVLTSFGKRRPQKYLGVPLNYTTCDGCYFEIHKLQYLCNAHLTFFKVF